MTDTNYTTLRAQNDRHKLRNITDTKWLRHKLHNITDTKWPTQITDSIGRVGQNYIYTVYTRLSWHHIYGRMRCIFGIFGREITKYTVILRCLYAVLAKPTFRYYRISLVLANPVKGTWVLNGLHHLVCTKDTRQLFSLGVLQSRSPASIV